MPRTMTKVEADIAPFGFANEAQYVLRLAARALVLVAAAWTLAACATVNVVQEKSRRFDEAIAAFDARDYPKAYMIWNTLSQENDLAAMRNAAHMLRRGLGVPRDAKAAFRLYKEAAEKGLVLAMANVGDLYLEGDGTEKDPEEAARWYARAAAGGLSIAMMRLGEMHEKGIGVKKEPGKARALYERAARNGYAPAQEKLAAMGISPGVTAPNLASASAVPPPARSAPDPKQPVLTAPTPVAAGGRAEPEVAPSGTSKVDLTAVATGPVDPAQLAPLTQYDRDILQNGASALKAQRMDVAFKAFQESANRGVAEGQFRLAWLYEQGKGTRQDVIEAYRWYSLAALQGHPAGAQGRTHIGAQLSPAERAIGNSLVNNPQPAVQPAKPKAAQP